MLSNERATVIHPTEVMPTTAVQKAMTIIPPPPPKPAMVVSAADSGSLTVAGVTLSSDHRMAQRGHTPIQLSAKEGKLLSFFMTNAGRIISRAQLFEHVWNNMKREDSSNVADVYVSMLRRKIDKHFDHKLIHTIIGTGYMFSAQPPSVFDRSTAT